MVLLSGIPGESPLEFIADELEKLNINFQIFSQRKMENLFIYYEINNGKMEGEISLGNKSYLLSEITGVYNRTFDFSQTPEYKNLDKHGFKFNEFLEVMNTFNNWLINTDARVLNQNLPMASNSSKLYQMLIIKEVGLQIPDSLVSNNIDSVLKYQKKNTEIIYKSASGVRSIVKKFNDSNNINLIENCPPLFQECLVGINYRVHIVGDKIFPTKINSEAVDYRYARKDNQKVILEEVNLPQEIENSCFELSRKLNLPLAGIDLMHTLNDEWFCFEVNPSPAFSYYENNTGQPIAEAIAKYLANMN